MTREPKYPAQTVVKAIEILNYLASDINNRGISISDISRQLGMGKSTVHRLLDTLLCYDFIEKNEETNCYRLGWKLYTIGKVVPQQNQLGNLDNRYLISVAKQTRETVNFGVLRHGEVVIIFQVDGSRDSNLRVNMRPGEIEPVYATALGKVMLSQMEKQEIVDVAQKVLPFKRYTENTIQTVEELLQELETVRKNGYAMDREEFATGLTCMACPIRDFTGKIVAAMSVSMPTVRYCEAAHNDILEVLREAVRRASHDLGYRSDD